MRTRAAAWCLLIMLIESGWMVAAPGEELLYKDPSASIDDRADDLLARMTLEEKVAQLATMYPNANVRLGIPHLKSADLRVEPTGPDAAAVRFTITNTGQRSGDEVVQLYVHDEYSSVVRPLKELKAFQRTSLGPGQTRTIEIELAREAFAFYDVGGRTWRVEPGRFEIMVGSSSGDIRLRGVVDLLEAAD